MRLTSEVAIVERFARSSPGTQIPFPLEDLLESGIYLRDLRLITPDTQRTYYGWNTRSYLYCRWPK